MVSSNIVQAYLRMAEIREDDNPINDLVRLALLAAKLAGISQYDQLPPFPGPDLTINSKSEQFIRRAAEYLFAIYPAGSVDEWALLFGAIVYERYGKTTVYFKKKSPAALKRRDAKKMSAVQLQQKYGISRSHAHRLRASAVTKK